MSHSNVAKPRTAADNENRCRETVGLAESWARQREHGAGDRGLRRSARGTSARGANHPKTPKQAFIDPEFL